MALNRASLRLSTEQLTQVEQGLFSIEQALTGLISLSADERRRLTKMGDRSEAFARQSLRVLAQNPHIVPASLDLADAQADLQALDQLAPVLFRLQRLAERGRDTEMALGADVMATALAGYRLLEVSGKQQGLDGLRKELSARWTRGRSSGGAAMPDAEPAPDPA